MATDDAIPPILAPKIVGEARQLGAKFLELPQPHQTAIREYLRHTRLTIETQTGAPWEPAGDEFAHVEATAAKVAEGVEIRFANGSTMRVAPAPAAEVVRGSFPYELRDEEGKVVGYADSEAGVRRRERQCGKTAAVAAAQARAFDVSAVLAVAQKILRLATRTGTPWEALSPDNQQAVSYALAAVGEKIHALTGCPWEAVGDPLARAEQAEQALLAAKHCRTHISEKLAEVRADLPFEPLGFPDTPLPNSQALLDEGMAALIDSVAVPGHMYESVRDIVSRGAYELEPTEFDSRVPLVVPADGADAHYAVVDRPQE